MWPALDSGPTAVAPSLWVRTGEYLEMWYRGGVGRMQGTVGVCNRVAQFLLGEGQKVTFKEEPGKLWGESGCGVVTKRQTQAPLGELPAPWADK